MEEQIVAYLFSREEEHVMFVMPSSLESHQYIYGGYNNYAPSSKSADLAYFGPSINC